MAYLTELADWMGYVLEGIVGFLTAIHLGVFVLMLCLFLASFIVLLFFKLKKITQGDDMI